MASLNFPFALFLPSLFFHAILGELICEELPKNVCAFSIGASGKRCLLETSSTGNGDVEYQCRTSEVVVERMSDYIETDECIKACGVDRNTVGISSDALLDPNFTSKLCSPSCYQKCPNIVDLYFNLAAGEGVFLADLCEASRTNPHRSMISLMSSGGVAAGPASSADVAAPGPVPSAEPLSLATASASASALAPSSADGVAPAADSLSLASASASTSADGDSPRPVSSADSVSLASASAPTSANADAPAADSLSLATASAPTSADGDAPASAPASADHDAPEADSPASASAPTSADGDAPSADSPASASAPTSVDGDAQEADSLSLASASAPATM